MPTMKRLLILPTLLSLASVGRGNDAAMDAKKSTPADQVEKTLQESTAYQTLLLEIKALEKKIKTKQYGYYGQGQRKRDRAQLTQLQRVKIRIDSYAFSLPPNCAEYQPLAVGTAPPTAVRVLTSPGERIVEAPGRKEPGFKPANAYTPRDLRCRPRMRVSDQMVGLVRESEQLNHLLKTRRFAFHEIEQRRHLQRQQIQLERRLLKMGVAPDVRATVTQIDEVDVTVRGGKLAPTRSP